MVFEEDDSQFDDGESDTDDGNQDKLALEPMSVGKAIPGNRNSRQLIERRLELLKLREQLEDPGFNCDFD
jgi:hypothetical protein